MVGDFAVGKTSLTQRFVNNTFSDKYLTTIGVKIDSLEVQGTKLIIWDIAGRDDLTPLNASYLFGAGGVVLVADGTRPETVQSLPGLWATVVESIGEVPAVVALNKHDHAEWTEDNLDLSWITAQGWSVFNTSAQQGTEVIELFTSFVADQPTSGAS